MINKPKDAFNNALDSAKNFKMPEVPKFPNMPGSGGNPNPNGINSNNGLQPIPTPMPSDTLKK